MRVIGVRRWTYLLCIEPGPVFCADSHIACTISVGTNGGFKRKNVTEAAPGQPLAIVEKRWPPNRNGGPTALRIHLDRGERPVVLLLLILGLGDLALDGSLDVFLLVVIGIILCLVLVQLGVQFEGALAVDELPSKEPYRARSGAARRREFRVPPREWGTFRQRPWTPFLGRM